MLTTPGILALLAVTVSGSPSRNCPFPCKCYTEDVDCSNRTLTHLWDGMFNWTGAERLPELTFENNQLTSLTPHIFDSLWGLKTLNLNHNHLHTLEVDVFSKLRNLRFLDMKDNQLTTLPEGLFAFQKKLVALDLRNNILATLDANVMSPLLTLSTLAIEGNPLNCDCRLQPVVIWSSATLESTDAKCRSPPQYRGRNWSVLRNARCTTSSPTVNNTTSSETTTQTADIEVDTSMPVVDNYTEVVGNGTRQENIEHAVNWSSTEHVTLVTLCLFCLLVLIVALVFVFWYKKLKARGTDKAASDSGQDKGLEPLYDDIGLEGNYECIDMGKKDGKNSARDDEFDTVRYVPGP